MFTINLQRHAITAFLICVGMVSAFPGPYRSPGYEITSAEDPHQSHSYHFRYAVHDPITGDMKDHNEVSDGRGNVRGTYSLIEADGSKRVVEYTADDVHGFRAEVKRIESIGQGKVTAAEHGSFDGAATSDDHESYAKAPELEVPSRPAPIRDEHDDVYSNEGPFMLDRTKEDKKTSHWNRVNRLRNV